MCSVCNILCIHWQEKCSQQLVSSSVKAPSLGYLQRVAQSDKKIRNSKAWEFMGILSYFDSASGRSCPIDDQLYCKFCFDEQKAEVKVTCRRSVAVKNQLLLETIWHMPPPSTARNFTLTVYLTAPKLTTCVPCTHIQHTFLLNMVHYNTQQQTVMR